MLVGVVSDTHLLGKPLPGTVLDELAGSELILHAGDILEMAVVEQLSEIARTVAVRGNMDHGEVASRLPDKRIVDVEGFRIGLTHGYGPPSNITWKVGAMFEDVDCVVFGHTHQPLIKWRKGILFFNPGSPTDRMFADRHTVGFLEVRETIEPRIVDLSRAEGESP